MTAVLVTFALLTLLSVLLWLPAVEIRIVRLPWWIVLAVLIAGLALTGLFAAKVSTFPDTNQALITVVCSMLVATCGGGPLTLAMLRGVERSGVAGVSDTPEHPPAVTAAPGGQDVLRGGAWIGLLERAAVAGSLLVGMPEGVAVTVAVKGLARYPELRVAGASERFIIGTFASTLWAASAAGVANILIP